MALVVKDRVKETTATTGTGTLTLAGAVTGFQTFTSVLSDGDTTYYGIFESATGAFEVGLGTFTSSGTTLARTTILESSNSGSAVNLGAGNKDVFITQPAEKAVYLDASGYIAAADGRNVTNVAASTAATLATARNIGGVSFDGSANIDLAGVNTAGNQDTSGNAATATALETGRTISLTGDVTGTSGSFDGSGNASIAATIAANSVALGTDTTGNYVADITAGTAIDVSGGGGETATVTVNVDLSELSTSTTNGDGDDFGVVDTSNAQRKLTKGNINISGFNNDSGYSTTTGTVTSVATGGGLTGGTITGSGTLSHADTSSQGSVNNSGATVIQDVTLDTYGHVTGLGSHTLTLANLGYTGATNANYITNNNQLTNGAGYTTYTANQSLNTSNSPTFNIISSNSWYYNNNAGQGLYNAATGAHFMSEASGQWTIMDADSTMQLRFETNSGSYRGSVYADSGNGIGFLDSDGSWAIQHVRDSRTGFYVNGTEYMRLDTNGLYLYDGSLREDYDALSGTSPTCNVNNGGAFSLSMSGNTTFSFTSPSSGYSTGFILQLTGNGSTVTWPSSVDWAGGTAPDAPASGASNLYVFWTRDGGSNWVGVLSAAAYA